jgi:putative phosphonate metabolism protein
MSSRYAIYFAPPKATPWWTLGAHWLGRDEFNNTALAPTEIFLDIDTEERLAITAEPRRYGFHATLKAPFRLGQNKTLQELLDRTSAVAAKLAPLALGPLRAVSLGNFVALTPRQPSAELQTLAANCVVALDDMRAPLTPEDLARRRVERLDAREMELLNSYGYPYVLERFRLHFSLTGPVDFKNQQLVLRAVAAQVNHLNTAAPLVLDRLCVFEEASPGMPFGRIADMPLSV